MGKGGNFMKLVFLALAWVGSVSLAEAKFFEYELPSFPNMEGNCNQTAIRAGQILTEATGVEVIRTVCDRETELGCDLRLAYNSETPLLRVSTNGFLSLSSPIGRYPDKIACEKNREEETRLFEASTGLKPVFSYCFRENDYDPLAWFPIIEGFGEPAKAPRVSTFFLFGLPKNITGSEFAQGIKNALTRQGGNLISFVVRSMIAYGQATIHLYSKEEIPVRLREYTKVDSSEQCASQAAEARVLLADTPNDPAVIYCGYISVGNFWELNVFFVGKETVMTRPSLETFKTFDECENGRQDLVKYYQQVMKSSVRGGLCSRDDQSYRVILFETPVDSYQR